MTQSTFLQNWTTFLNSYQHTSDEAIKLFLIQTCFTQRSRVAPVDLLLILPPSESKTEKCLQFLYSELISGSNSFILKGELLDLLHRLIYASYNAEKLVDAANIVNTFIDFLLNVCFNHVTNHENTMYRIRALNILSFYVEYEKDDAPTRYIHDTYGCDYLIQEAQKLSTGNNLLLAEHYLLFLFRYCCWICSVLYTEIGSHPVQEDTTHEIIVLDSMSRDQGANDLALHCIPSWMKEQRIMFEKVDLRQGIIFFLESFSYFSRFTQCTITGMFLTFYKQYIKLRETSAMKDGPSLVIMRSALSKFFFETDDLSMIGEILRIAISEDLWNPALPENASILRAEDYLTILSKLEFIVCNGGTYAPIQIAALGWLCKLVDTHTSIHRNSNKINSNENKSNYQEYISTTAINYLWNRYKLTWRENGSSCEQSNNLYPQPNDDIQIKHSKCILFFNVLKGFLSLNVKHISSEENALSDTDLENIEKALSCFSDFNSQGREFIYLDKLLDILIRIIDCKALHVFIAKTLVKFLQHNIDISKWLELEFDQRSDLLTQSILSSLYDQVQYGGLQPHNIPLNLILPIYLSFLQKHIGSPLVILDRVLISLERYTLQEDLHSWQFGIKIIDLIRELLTDSAMQIEFRTQIIELLSFCYNNFENADIRDQSHLYLQMLHFCSPEQVSKLTCGSTNSNFEFESFSTSITDSVEEEQISPNVNTQFIDNVFTISKLVPEYHDKNWWNTFVNENKEKDPVSLCQSYREYINLMSKKKSKLLSIAIPFILTFDNTHLSAEEDAAYALSIQFRLLKNETFFAPVQDLELTQIHLGSPIQLRLDLYPQFPVPTEIEINIVFSTRDKISCATTLKKTIIVDASDLCQRSVQFSGNNNLFDKLWDEMENVTTPIDGASSCNLSDCEVILLPGQYHILRRGRFLRADHYSLFSLKTGSLST